MTTPAYVPGRTTYRAAWVSNTGRRGRLWSAPCDTPGEAQALGEAEVLAGRAAVAFVVEFAADGSATPLPNHTWPKEARRTVQHWEALWEACEPPGEEE